MNTLLPLKLLLHPQLESFVQLCSLQSQEIIKGLGRAAATGREMLPCPSMLPRAEEQLKDVSPFPLLSPFQKQLQERLKALFLMRCCSSNHLIFADLPMRKPLMTTLK